MSCYIYLLKKNTLLDIVMTFHINLLHFNCAPEVFLMQEHMRSLCQVLSVCIECVFDSHKAVKSSLHVYPHLGSEVTGSSLRSGR